MYKSIGILLCALVSIMLVSCGGADERKSVYMEKAVSSFEEGDYDKARIEYKNVLQIDPKEHRAYFGLGNVFEKKEQFDKAFRNYSKAASVAPEETEYQQKIGRYYLLLGGNVKKAKEILATIKAIDENDINGMLLAAGIAAFEKDYDLAISISSDILEKDKNNLESSLLMASLLSEKKKYEEAIDLLEKASVEHTSSSALTRTLVKLYLVTGQSDKAESALKSLVENNPDNYPFAVLLARYYVSVGDKDAAEAVLYSSIDRLPDDIRVRMDLVNFVRDVRSREEAITVLKEQIAKFDDDAVLRLALAKLYLEDDDLQSAKQVLQAIITDYPEEQEALKSRLILAEIAIKEKDVALAEKYVNDAYDVAPNDADVNMYKARIELHNKNIEQAIISLRTVIKDSPENLKAYIYLAEAHKLNGELDQAQDVMTRAHENNRGNADNLIELAKMYLRTKDFAVTERIIDDYLRIKNDDYDALSIKANILLATNRASESLEFAQKLLDLFPGKKNGYILSAAGMLQTGQQAELDALLKRGLEKTDNDTSLLTMAVRVLLSQNRLQEAIDLATEVINTGKGADAHKLLASIYIDNKMMSKSVATIEEAIKQYPQDEQLYLLRANQMSRAGETGKIKPFLEKASDTVTPSVTIDMMLGSIYDRDGEPRKALSSYRKVLAENPTDIITMNNVAALMVDNSPTASELEEAVTMADVLKNVDKPEVKDTVAWVYYHATRYEESSVLYKQLMQVEPDNPTYNYHYGMLLKAMGDTDNSRLHLEKSLSGDDSFREKEAARAALKELG